MPESHGTVVMPREPSISRKVATAVVQMARRFQSDILFSFETIHINAKSPLMAFILLEALKGRRVELSARGPDARVAVQALLKLFDAVI